MDSTDELEAMRHVAQALDPLDDDARMRIVGWASARYRVAPRSSPTTNLIPLGVTAASGDEAVSDYENLAVLFDAADPQTEAEKVLIAAHWLQKQSGAPNIEAAAVNRELKHLGHAVRNVTMAFNVLLGDRPALVVQMAKSGNTKQARKKYMVTRAGEKYLQQMLARAGGGNE